jgi:hypothetical protein
MRSLQYGAAFVQEGKDMQIFVSAGLAWNVLGHHPASATWDSQAAANFPHVSSLWYTAGYERWGLSGRMILLGLGQCAFL